MGPVGNENSELCILFMSISESVFGNQFLCELLDETKCAWYPSLFECGSNSVVECDLAKVEVVGSNPISRSIFSRYWLFDGAVAKR